MNLTLKQPAWTAALWMLLLSRCNDGSTNAATAAAFAPDYHQHHQQQIPSTLMTKNHNKRNKRRTLDNNKLTSSNTRADQAAFVMHSTSANTVDEMTRIKKLDTSYNPVTSVTRINLPYYPKHKHDWTQLVPPISLLKNDAEKRLDDVRIEWGPEDDLQQVAHSMLESFFQDSQKVQKPEMVRYLAKCMKTFQDFCTEQFLVDEALTTSTNAIQGFRARIVCTRGSSGTKCPNWHVDHVPVRWIQSLVGPGCDYIESSSDSTATTSMEEWYQMQQQLLEEQEDDSKDNDKQFDIPGPSHLQCHQAKEFQAVLMAGNRWNEFSKEPHPFVPPVLHKSPTNLPFWQGRVLLTMDVIAPHPPFE